MYTGWICIVSSEVPHDYKLGPLLFLLLSHVLANYISCQKFFFFAGNSKKTNKKTETMELDITQGIGNFKMHKSPITSNSYTKNNN